MCCSSFCTFTQDWRSAALNAPTHTYTQTYIHACKQASKQACMHTYKHTCMHACIYKCMNTCIEHECVHRQTCIWLHCSTGPCRTLSSPLPSCQRCRSRCAPCPAMPNTGCPVRTSTRPRLSGRRLCLLTLRKFSPCPFFIMREALASTLGGDPGLTLAPERHWHRVATCALTT